MASHAVAARAVDTDLAAEVWESNVAVNLVESPSRGRPNAWDPF